MNCPTESHRLEEFTKKSNYENSDTPIYRPNGVKIIKAVRLYSQKDYNNTRMKLEELLGQTLSRSGFVDSASRTFGCDPDCDCNREKHCNCDNKCNHCRCVSDCRCDNDTRCSCQGVCISVY